jgi:hypothetical protein
MINWKNIIYFSHISIDLVHFSTLSIYSIQKNIHIYNYNYKHGSEEQLLLTHLSIPLFSLDPTLNFFISFCR